jgi:hypothetical protein
MSHPRGRQSIGLNQPPASGSNYPFVAPSADIQRLFADFYVSYYAPGSAYNGKLKIGWMYGFGTDVNSPIIGRPTPTHDYDLILEDFENNVVFSTLSTTYSTSTWDGRLRIIEWVGDTFVIRCAIHTAWDAAEESSAPTYDLHLEPDNAVLDPHVIYAVPDHVTAFYVNGQLLTTPRIEIAEGYNIGLEIPDSSTDLVLPGTATSVVNQTTKIQVSAIPGTGLGAFPGCTETDPPVRTIGNVQGNAHQNLTLSVLGCFRVQRPVTITEDGDERLADYASDGLSSDEAAASLLLSNDCTPCCDCSYFVRTYKGIKRLWDQYQSAATSAEDLRDDYANIVERWLEHKTCRETNTVRSSAAAEGKSKVGWGVAHCNASKCCLTTITARLTWIYRINGVVQLPNVAGYDCQKTAISSPTLGENPIRIYSDRGADTQGIVNVFVWSTADSQSTTTLTGRHCFPEAETAGDDIVQVQAHWCIMWDTAAPDAETGDPCTYPTLASEDYPADVRAMWDATGDDIPENGRAQHIGELVTIKAADLSCEKCECETPLPTTPASPKRLPNVCHWWDGSDARTLTLSGANVAEWRSKRGTKVTLKVPPTKSAPTYDTDRLLFNGGNQALYNLFYNLTYQAGYVAIVYSAAANDDYLFSAGTAGVGGENFYLQTNRAQLGTVAVSDTIAFGDLRIVIVTVSGVGVSVTEKLYYNGEEVDTDTTSRTGVAQSVVVGVGPDLATGPLDGSICEIIVGCEVLTTYDRQVLEGYLAWKWDLQSELPSDHPHKDSPPLV